MKESMHKLILVIALVVIIAGAIMVGIKGFKFDLHEQGGQRIELNLGKEFNNEDIKLICKDVFEGQDVLVQKVEIYEDSVSILTKEITEEQRSNLISKINEKYELDMKTENTEIVTVPHTRLRDMVKPYVMPVIIATVVILAYMMVRYNKLNSLLVLTRTIGTFVLTECLLFGVIGLVRIPVGRFTIPMTLTVYALTWIWVTSVFEKELEEKKTNESK